jgi:Ca2+-binding RTX toxin-like protein
LDHLIIGLGLGGDAFTIQSTHTGTTEVDTNAGSDTVNVRTTGGETTVNTGTDDDTIRVGGLAPGIGGTVDGIGALLTLDAGEGNDALTVDDTGDATGNGGTLTASTLTGLGMSGGIEYGNLESLEIFLGSGDDTFEVTGTMKRADGFQTVTALSTGAGDDTVAVSLDAASDGFFSVDAEAGDDAVDASASTLPLVIFGGEDDDTLLGGQAQDIIFGDRGRVDYRDSTGKLVTRLGLGLAERNVLGPNDAETTVLDVPYRQTDGLVHAPSLATTRDPASGGVDTISGNAGDDLIFGGAQGDSIQAGAGNDIVLGDHGNATFTAPGTIGKVSASDPTLGGNDTIDAGSDDDVVFGGTGDDSILGGSGNDWLFGDHGSWTVGSAPVPAYGDPDQGNGDDMIDAGSGNDHLVGGPGNDQMYGRDGSDTYIFAGANLGSDIANEAVGAPGSDTLDFSEFAGSVTLDLRLAGPQWIDRPHTPADLVLTLQDPEGFENVIGSTHGNTIDGNDADNHITGGGGDDVLHGRGGNDVLDGLGGNDILFGDQGDDTLNGGAGNDVLVGDLGMVKRLSDGQIEVLLIDQASVTGDLDLSNNGVGSAQLGADLWLLTGIQDSHGHWDSHLLTLALYAAGNDTLNGDEGSDLAFGGRGDDAINGGAGDDYLEGNEGNDTIHGGEDNDIIVGDSSYNFVPTPERLPTVLHGYELNPKPYTANGSVPDQGPVVVPMAAVLPAGVDTVDPFGSVLYEGTRQASLLTGLLPYLDAKGQKQTVFASIVPDVSRHLSLLPGNDTLYGDAGADRMIGDNNAIIAPFQDGVQCLVSDFGNVAGDLTWLEQVLPPAPADPPLAVAADTIHGGEGDDIVIGDDNLMLVASAATTGSLPAGLAQAAGELAHTVDVYTHMVKGKPASLGFVSGGDTIYGEAGNDLLVGDHNVAIGIAVDGPVGSAASDWLCNVHLDRLTVQGGQDTLSGGSGDDQLIGDSQVVLIASVGGNPFSALDGVAVAPNAAETLAIGRAGAQTLPPVAFAGGVEPFLPAVQAATGTGASGYHTVEIDGVLGHLTLTGGKDALDGGTEDDYLVGDNQVLIAAVVQGPLADLQPGVATPDRALVEVCELVCEVDLDGAQDTLAGGDGNDTLIGDNQATVTGVLAGPVLQVGAGQGGTRYYQSTRNDELVQFGGLIGELSLRGANDTLSGGAGDDQLIGDHHVLVSAVVDGPVLAGTDAATGYTAERAFETAVEFTQLVDDLDVYNGDDTLHGGEGADLLIGDSSMLIVDLLRGPVVSGPAAFVAQAGYTAPFTGTLVDFDGLVNRLDSNGGKDALYGDSGDDTLIGDDQLAVAGVVEGALAQAGAGTISVPSKRSFAPDMVDFDGLLNCADLSGGADTLDGGAGDDLLIGDEAANVAAVIAGTGAAAGSLPASLKLTAEFNQLVGGLELGAQKDTLIGGDDNDVLVGDQEFGIAVVVTGAQAPDAAIIDVDGLAGSVSIDAYGDRLDVGAGEDRLIGDSQVAVTGVLLLGAGTPGNRSISIDGLLCNLCIDGGNDTLSAGDGNDIAFGDNAVALTGAALVHASAGATLASVHVTGLVGSMDVDAGCDSLDGGAGSDDLYGDNYLLVTGAVGQLDAGALALDIACRLVDDVWVDAGDDYLTGGDGNDRLTGDNRIEIAALAGSVAAGATLQLSVDALICDLCVDGGNATLLGGAGDDQLIGDNLSAVAALAVQGAISGSLTLGITELTDDFNLGSGCDKLDGGDGVDQLIGDQWVSVGALLDAGGRAGTAASTTISVNLIIHQLVDRVDIDAGGDQLTGGKGDDLLVGDNRNIVAAYLGAFSDPIGAGVRITGDRLVDIIDSDAGGDTLRGGDGNDTLVGDSDTTVAVIAGGTTAPAGSDALTREVYKLTVDSAGDSLNGDGGTNTSVSGNRATTPSTLVKYSSVSSRSSSAPAAGPVIDWLGGFAGGQTAQPAGAQPAWLGDFVNRLAQTPGERDPNAAIRIKVG